MSLGDAGEHGDGPVSFATTQWSTVLGAGHKSSPEGRAALERLCRAYWYPLYAFLRRSGHNATDAQDLIQSFFANLVEHDWLGTADPAKGRFRSFLLVCLKRFVGGEARKAHAQKRGGASVMVALDDEEAARRYLEELAEGLAPDEVYERRWALTLLEQAWDCLREECRVAERLPLFEHLQEALDGGLETPSGKALATSLRMTESALKSAMFRLRARYRDILRQEVAQTVSHPGEVDDEIRHLLQVLNRG